MIVGISNVMAFFTPISEQGPLHYLHMTCTFCWLIFLFFYNSKTWDMEKQIALNIIIMLLIL